MAHRDIRHGGIVTAATGRPQTPIVDAASLPIERLIDYDAWHFSSARPEFLRCWLRPDRRRGLLALRDGEIAGLGVIRACRQGFKIGPLFADDARIADVLFVALAADANGAMVCLDVPQGNPAAMALAAQHGLRPAFEIARMYRCRAPDLPIERNFGITSFELG
ncbi:MAG: hypothetical protein ACREEE_02520 [Dongiaceae bacterium]